MMNITTATVERKLLDEYFPEKELLNKKDVCKVLGIKRHETLKTRRIPWDRNGKISKSDMEKWLRK